MVLLSLDASTKSTGYAIFEDEILTKHGFFTSASTDVIKRIHKMSESLDALLQENKVDKIVLEEVRPVTNGVSEATFKALIYLQAEFAILLHDKYPKIKIEYSYPSEWRSYCNIKTGRGIKREELKKADTEFVKNRYGITVNDDEADAIGIGYAYLNKDKGAF